MKNYLKTMLLLIGMFFVSFSVMPAETKTLERCSLDTQEISIDNLSVSVDLQLIALDALSQSINNKSELFRQSIAFKSKQKVITQKQKALRQDLKKAGTERYLVNFNDTYIYKTALFANFIEDVEHRIRGVTNTTRTI
jgi:hypothetical protein